VPKRTPILRHSLSSDLPVNNMLINIKKAFVLGLVTAAILFGWLQFFADAANPHIERLRGNGQVVLGLFLAENEAALCWQQDLLLSAMVFTFVGLLFYQIFSRAQIWSAQARQRAAEKATQGKNGEIPFEGEPEILLRLPHDQGKISSLRSAAQKK